MLPNCTYEFLSYRTDLLIESDIFLQKQHGATKVILTSYDQGLS